MKTASSPPKVNRSAKHVQPVPDTLASVIKRFGIAAKSKLSNPAAQGQPEDQLRSPVERLVSDLARLCVPEATVTAVGESSIESIKTRPDFAVTASNALIGFVELKAPGKGANPNRFKDRHDKGQWERLKSLPNLVYTDGNEFSLWRDGNQALSTVRLVGDIETSGTNLEAPDALLTLFENFLRWEPIPPRGAKELAELSARLCRLLREEVTEQLALKNRALTALAKDWRRVLFPDASDEQFADGYAQAVTFGMLTARERKIGLAQGLTGASQKLGPTLIGAALRVLTFSAETAKLTSIGTLMRVLDAVDWERIGHGDPDAWLYFYEDFLAVYDNTLRKRTGSYYTPAPVVREMVRLVDEVLRTRFGQSAGLASESVTLADPAVGTGTFLLGVLRRIANTIEAEQGPGAVPTAIDAAVKRLIAFDIQLGPFAVAQLRVLAELNQLIGGPSSTMPRMYVTDTLANPYTEQEWLPYLYEELAESRKQANQIKKEEPIMVVLGNPPYKDKAMGRGGWIEFGDENPDGTKKTVPPLDAWVPPTEWGVGAHVKHLRNLYVYFWRWATWKVFDQNPSDTGVVCFISVAGFLNGPGFQRMREYLRRMADEIWVIDCSPEGHQPEVNTRIFEDVQQPICIVLASRSPRTDASEPATVRYRPLPKGDRLSKFEALTRVWLDQTEGWSDCSPEWRAPFRPWASGAWSTYPALEDLFVYNGSGVMPGRTWVIAPDTDSLRERWRRLLAARNGEKERLFHPHLVDGKPGDRHVMRVCDKGLPGHQARTVAVAGDRGPCIEPVRYAFRSFDRQWIIPDNRLINRPNPELWESHSEKQVYITALARSSPTAGPALTITGLIPDHDHYKGSFSGRVFPLWLDRDGTVSNIRPGVLRELARVYGIVVAGEDVMAYVAAIAAHPGFVERFREQLAKPGLRIPFTADVTLFREATELGKTIIWLHSFGERFVKPGSGRPAGPPRLERSSAPKIPKSGAIGLAADGMPDTMSYSDAERRLYVGSGYIEGVPPEVWKYEVSGKQIIRHWFSYRKANRERPVMGDRRPPSPLGEAQPNHWPAEYTTELMDLLHVLGRLVELEPLQATLLERVCGGKLIILDALQRSEALSVHEYPLKPTQVQRTPRKESHQTEFGYARQQHTKTKTR